MLDVDSPVLKRFWYPVAFSSDASARPMARKLLGTDIVLWSSEQGVRAAIDACPHRDAPLSLGRVDAGLIVCPYHGWKFDAAGRCREIPQQEPFERIPTRARLNLLPVRERFGLIWVSLCDEPFDLLPDIPEWGASSGWRFISEFDEIWNCSAPAIADHDLDCTHMSETHEESFACRSDPFVSGVDAKRTKYGVVARGGSGGARHGDPTPRRRLAIAEMWTPFSTVTRVTYPDGVAHITFRGNTPITSVTTRITQFTLRNDSEMACRESEVLSFDRVAADEDRVLLEAFHRPFSFSTGDNVHVATDRPTIQLRRLWSDLFAERWMPVEGIQWEPQPEFHAGLWGVENEIAVRVPLQALAR